MQRADRRPRLMRTLLEQVRGVPGDLIELGVLHGGTFFPMVEASAGRVCHAVDSFRGMGEPTGRDGDRYPAGRFNQGGPTRFVAALAERVRLSAIVSAMVVVWTGWVPEVLEGWPADQRFSFAHLDLDHYLPTLQALPWLWERLSPGGLLCCHDWFPGREQLAAGAIARWIQESGVRLAGEDLEAAVCWFVRSDEQ